MSSDGDTRDINQRVQDGDEERLFEMLNSPTPLKPELDELTEEDRKKLPSPPALKYLDDALEYWRQGGPKAISTGMACLDEKLGGGLYPGFIVLGAIPGLGKTTLALQIADNIAEGREKDGRTGQPRRVLFFSLEMTIEDIIAKSISRLTGEMAAEKRRPDDSEEYQKERFLSAVTSTRRVQSGVRMRYSPADWNTEEAIELFNAAVERYRTQIAPNITIVEAGESMGQFTVDDVKAEYKRQCANPDDLSTGPDLIVIDYLQLLALENPYGVTDKQRMDEIVLSLARLRREIDKPILVISSMARSNYSETIGLDSMKESGTIEYSAECVLGLQYSKDPTEDDKGKPVSKSEARSRLLANGRKWRREVELVILKSRHGVVGDTIPMDFFPAGNYYEEAGRKAKDGFEAEILQERATFLDPYQLALNDMAGMLMNKPEHMADISEILDKMRNLGHSTNTVYQVIQQSDCFQTGDKMESDGKSNHVFYVSKW